MRVRSVVAAFMAAMAVSLVASAQGDHWAGAEGRLDPEMRHLVRRDQDGEILDPEEQEILERYRHGHLIRPKMSVLESSQYSIAEIRLKRREFPKAIEALQRIIERAGDAKSELVWATHYNIARIYSHHLRDLPKALDAFLKVQGRWRDRGISEALSMLQQAGDWELGVALIEREYAAAKEKGHRLALLHRLARLYQGTGQDDQALATYERIGQEATPQDIEEMRKAVTEFVQETADAILKHRERDEWLKADKQHRNLGLRERRLREQGRMDEHDAFMKAMREAHQKLEAWEREREREEREER